MIGTLALGLIVGLVMALTGAGGGVRFVRRGVGGLYVGGGG